MEIGNKKQIAKPGNRNCFRYSGVMFRDSGTQIEMGGHGKRWERDDQTFGRTIRIGWL